MTDPEKRDWRENQEPFQQLTNFGKTTGYYRLMHYAEIIAIAKSQMKMLEGEIRGWWRRL